MACSTSSPSSDGGVDAGSDSSNPDSGVPNPGCEQVAEWWMRSAPGTSQPCLDCISNAEQTQPCFGMTPPLAGACTSYSSCVNSDCTNLDAGVCECMQSCDDGGSCNPPFESYLSCLYGACNKSCP